MIETLSAQDLMWLEKFFSNRNELKWEAVVSRSAPPAWLEQVIPWLSTFSASEAKSPLVLPVFDRDGPYQWYGVASNESDSNAMAHELSAFIGPSYSNFQGYPLESNSEDAIEKTLFERFGRFVFRLEPVVQSDSPRIVESLQLYLELLRRRPYLPARKQRPFGRIRAEFDKALLAGNEIDAIRLRDELLNSGRVDAEQEKYLEIRLLTGLGRQFHLAHDYPLIKSILGLSLPAQTIVDVVSALYATYITEIEGNGNDEVVLETFRKEIASNFGPLFTQRKGIVHPSVLKAFLLYELVQPTPNADRCQAIVSAYPEDSGKILVERWAAKLASSVPTELDLYEVTRQALMDEDYNIALQNSLQALPNSWAYSFLIRCAAEINEQPVTLKVLAVVDEATETVHQKFNERDLRRLQLLRANNQNDLSKNIQPTAKTIRPDIDWMSWITYVESGRYETPPLQILDEARQRWSLETYSSNPAKCQELADRIGNAEGVSEEIFRGAFVPLVEFFVELPEKPTRTFAPIYTMLIRIIAWNGVVTANELELASTLVQALIATAPKKEDYVEAIDAYSEILKANNAPGNVDWALNAAELLILEASPDNESRLRFFVFVFEMIRSVGHRLRSAQFEILSLLAKDYKCSALLESFTSGGVANEKKEINDEYSGLIGIYTLTESAGKRSQAFLQKRYPKAKIELNADFVATDKLKNLAANSNIFVFAWRSSKHQAFYAVKAARRSKKILLPLGKGSVSILECIEKEINDK